MHGRNPVRPLDRTDGTTLDVFEIFRTIQGEGPFIGCPATFVRLWGCHLHCTFCDTDFESVNTRRTLSSLLAELAHGPELVVFTGGEPLRQNIYPICAGLLAVGKKVQIETAGSFGLGYFTPPNHDSLFLDPNFSVVVSPKVPFVDEEIAAHAIAWKYIISDSYQLDPVDGLPVTNTQTDGGTARPLARPPSTRKLSRSQIWVQPMDEQNPYRNQLNTERCVALAYLYGYRVSLQLHKILGVP